MGAGKPHSGVSRENAGAKGATRVKHALGSAAPPAASHTVCTPEDHAAYKETHARPAQRTHTFTGLRR